MDRELSLPIKKTLFICLFLMDRQRNITEDDTSKSRHKRKTPPPTKTYWPGNQNTSVEIEVPDLPVIMFDFLPELQQQFTPLLHQETPHTSHSSRHYIFLVCFSYMEWRVLMLQVKAELPRSFFLRNHRKKTMPRMVGSQCFVQGFPASLGSFFFSCVITRAGGLG